MSRAVLFDFLRSSLWQRALLERKRVEDGGGFALILTWDLMMTEIWRFCLLIFYELFLLFHSLSPSLLLPESHIHYQSCPLFGSPHRVSAGFGSLVGRGELLVCRQEVQWVTQQTSWGNGRVSLSFCNSPYGEDKRFWGNQPQRTQHSAGGQGTGGIHISPQGIEWFHHW